MLTKHKCTTTNGLNATKANYSKFEHWYMKDIPDP